jgi:hypothetical protein
MIWKSSILPAMGEPFIRRLSSVALSGVLLFAGLSLPSAAQHNGRKYTPPPATATIKVTVVRSAIPNAAVVFHPMEGDKDKGALELKSDEDGKVTIDVIPIGDTVRLQVIADGWQTYGDDYKIDTDSKEILVKMKRPGSQYSLYGDGHGTAPSTTTPKGESNSAKPSQQTPLPQ